MNLESGRGRSRTGKHCMQSSAASSSTRPWTRPESHRNDLPAEEISDLSHEPVLERPGSARAPAAFYAERESHRRAELPRSGPAGNRTRMRVDANDGSDLSHEPISLAVASREGLEVEPYRHADQRSTGGSGRSRTLFRGFGGRVARLRSDPSRRCPAARRQRPKPLIGLEPMSSSSASYRTRTGLNPWTGGLRRPSHHEAKSLLAASRTRPTRLGNACLGSARTKRWGEWPELNRASAVSQTALVTERVHPPQVRMGRIELPPRRPERRAQPMTLHPADSLRASTSNRTTFSGASSQRYHQTSSRRMLVTRRGYDPRLTV